MKVTGGAGGVDADYDDMFTLADSSDDLAFALGRISGECHAVAADPDLLASAALAPVSAARFTGALLAALDGPDGLTAQAAVFGVRALGLRTAVATYEATDRAQAAMIDAVRFASGLAAPVALPVAIAGAGLFAVTHPEAVVSLVMNPPDIQKLLTNHPGTVDAVVGAGPGLISWLPGVGVTDVPGAADLIANLYPDGRHTVTDVGVDANPRTGEPPAGIGDLIDGLDHRNGEVSGGEPDQIDVRVITAADGTRSFVVDIPGTKDWNGPLEHNPELNDLGTNLHVLAGDVSTREHAIAEALRQAGASSTDPVMLIGHSQGGMVAAQAAHDHGNGTFDFNVTHVVTAGSPVGRIEVPGDVQVLSLENKHDIVPHLDAAANPDRENWTTVEFANQHGTIGEEHSTSVSYLPAARDLDASTDPSIVAFRESAEKYLSGDQVENRVYELTRVP
ncbi:esterase/lipase family protein [Actinoplanes sp. CA-015351]|uniref:esterase/lipase family protein n=1 Tax=Actinoplanes sp. CA-015351 TaxID=3239897 RepID=UPI003D965DB7